MAIPVLREDGWLPEGHWLADWSEVTQAFGGSEGSHRAKQLRLLLEWRDSVQSAGISGRLLLNGSFVSSKEDPGDVDALLVFDESTEALLEQDVGARELLNHSSMKRSGFGDLFCFAESTVQAFPKWCRLDMFDVDKKSGLTKGVLELRV